MQSLGGLRIVVTRATHQAEQLAVPLREAGAEVLYLPMVGIEGPQDPAPLRETAAQCDLYDWIVFTSANAVLAFVAELPEPRPGCRAYVAAVGASTAEAARQNGFDVKVTPTSYVAEELAEALGRESLAGKRVLIPAAAVSRDVVPQTLKDLGAAVEVVEAYRNVVPSGAAQKAAELMHEPLPDWITFASPSAVDHLVALVGPGQLGRIKAASIGPVTSASLRKRGLKVAAEARTASARGIVEAILGTLDRDTH